MKTLAVVLLLTTNAFAFQSQWQRDVLNAQEQAAYDQGRAADAAERSAAAAEDVATAQMYTAVASVDPCSYSRVSKPDGSLETITLGNGKVFPVYLRVCNGHVMEGR